MRRSEINTPTAAVGTPVDAAPAPAPEPGAGASAQSTGVSHDSSGQGGRDLGTTTARKGGGAEIEEAEAVRREALALRFGARTMARRMLRGSGRRDVRLASCGQPMGGVRVIRRGRDGRHRLTGVDSCQMSRVCPVCGPKVAARRAAEIAGAVWRWTEAGHGAAFVSINGSHKASDVLAVTHGQLLDARAKVCDAKREAWRTFRRRFGIYDVAWKIEHSRGENGPHPGLHLILLTDEWWTVDQVDGAEAWLWREFRRALEQLGFEGRLSPTRGVLVEPVDDAAVGHYLAKWGVGRELTGEYGKVGRNGENMPYLAIPQLLAEMLGRMDPIEAADQRVQVRRLVADWLEFFDLAWSDAGSRKWFSGFYRLNKLVPELRDVTDAGERIALCTELLPEHLQPPRADDTEQQGDEDPSAEGDGEAQPGSVLMVSQEAAVAALIAWMSRRGAPRPVGWTAALNRWFSGGSPCQVDLWLAVAWLADEQGLELAARAVAELAGADVGIDEFGHFTVSFEWEEQVAA